MTMVLRHLTGVLLGCGDAHVSTHLVLLRLGSGSSLGLLMKQGLTLGLDLHRLPRISRIEEGISVFRKEDSLLIHILLLRRLLWLLRGLRSGLTLRRRRALWKG